jgi:hypothetical protein
MNQDFDKMIISLDDLQENKKRSLSTTPEEENEEEKYDDCSY